MFSQEDQDSRLKINYYEMHGSKAAELLAVISALEIRILPADDDFENIPIDFSWAMTGFSNSFVNI